MKCTKRVVSASLLFGNFAKTESDGQLRQLQELVETKTFVKMKKKELDLLASINKKQRTTNKVRTILKSKQPIDTKRINKMMKDEFDFLKSINQTIIDNVDRSEELPIKVTIPLTMGIEGSGHHSIMTLYGQIAKKVPPNQVKSGKSIFMNVGSSPSYPYNNNFQWPDFNNLISQIDAVADLFPNIEVEAKVIVLKRKWIEAIASSCRRFGKCDKFTNGTMNRPQANFKGALMIDEQLKKIEKSNWMMLDYNELVGNPMDFGEELASFWNVETDAVNKALESIHSPKESEKADIWNKLSQKYGQDLCDYMNDKFYSNETAPNGLAGTVWTN